VSVAERVGRDTEVPPVRDCQPTCPHQPSQITIGYNQDVVDDMVGWSHFVVAVVPCKLGDLQKVKRNLNRVAVELSSDRCRSLTASLCPTNCHVAPFTGDLSVATRPARAIA
jgi:hypothetical protein